MHRSKTLNDIAIVIEVRTDEFENDFETSKSKENVLTLLNYLGYLTWHEEDETAHIPNEEVRIEFEKILEGTEISQKWPELLSRFRDLLEDTIAGNGPAVAKAVEEIQIRGTQYSPTFYNDEQVLQTKNREEEELKCSWMICF